MERYDKILSELLDLMRRDGLDRLRLQVEGIDLDLRMSLPAARSGDASAVASPQSAAGTAASSPLEAPPDVCKVYAPLVGVFYRAAAPGAAPFVEPGQTVSEGQVLCILEAMKLMNEIVSECDGKVVRVCVNDGELVALNQELFWIQR